MAFDKLRLDVPYTLRETKAPAGHRTGADYTFTIPGTAEQPDVTYDYTDEPDTAAEQVTKTDSRTGQKLDGAEFLLTGRDFAGRTVSRTAATVDGLATFLAVPVGSYTISEQKAPAGYSLSGRTIPVTVTDGDSTAATYYTKTQQFGIADDQLGVIAIDKTDAQTGRPLAGARFELTDASDRPVRDADGNTVAAQTTDADGRAVFGNLPIDRQNGTEYRVREVSAPDGYAVDSAEPVAAILTAQNPAATREFADTHKPGSVRVQKTGENGSPLAGATFTLTDSAGKTVFTATSDRDGYAFFPAVPLGSYTLRKTAAPAGYLVNSQIFSVQITDDNYTRTQLFRVSDLVVTLSDNDPPLGDRPEEASSLPAVNPKTGDGRKSGPLLWLALAAGAAAAGTFLLRRRRAK